MTKIVRKVQANGVVTAFWLDQRDEMRGWWEKPGDDPGAAEKQARSWNGWTAEEKDAALVGTTLAALRDELTEEGKDG